MAVWSTVNNIKILYQMTFYFQILNFTKPVSIESRQTWTAFLLKFHPNDTQLHFTTYLTLYTNASQFVIPIVVYNGLLQVSIYYIPPLFAYLYFSTEMWKGSIIKYVCSVINFMFTNYTHILLHFVIKFVNVLQQVGGFLWVLQFPPPIKLTTTI